MGRGFRIAAGYHYPLEAKMINLKAKMILVFILILLSIFAAIYCMMGYAMVGSFSVTPGYPKELATSQAYLWLSAIIGFSTIAVVLKIFVLNKLVKKDKLSDEN